MKEIIIGTAGHIDHGKSTLIRALTGTDPDRLAEEKRRGITIDLGFAHLALKGEARIGFVDVPGHQRFLRNMLAGAGGIDAVLLVVAANESVMPQTREHFEICRLLGVRRGLIAVTKCDLVDEDLLALVCLEIQEYVRGSFLEEARVVPVSAETGDGLEALKAALLELSRVVQCRKLDAGFRLPVDRSFSLRGFGTVVTGSLISGTIARDEEVEIQPTGRRVRIRGIQVYGQGVPRAIAGQRAALNLQNVKVDEIQRGMELTRADLFQPVVQLFARLEVLSTSPVSIKSRGRFRVHYGTGEARCVVHPIDTNEMPPGSSAYVRLVFDRPVMAVLGDRLILRRASPTATVGGGVVLDLERPTEWIDCKKRLLFLDEMASCDLSRWLGALARRRAKRGIDEVSVRAMTNLVLSDVLQGFYSLAEAGRLQILADKPLWAMDTAAFTDLSALVVRTLTEFHQSHPLAAGLPKQEFYSTCFRDTPPSAGAMVLSKLMSRSEIVVDRELLSLPGRAEATYATGAAARSEIEFLLMAAGLRVPSVNELLGLVSVPKDLAMRSLSFLIKEGVVVKIAEEMVMHNATLNEVREKLSQYKKISDMIDIASFKSLFDISRKYAIPLLAYLDRERITRRVGEQRWIE